MGLLAPILLLEANEDDSFLLRRALKRRGVENPVQTTTRADEAIAFLNSRDGSRPAFVIVSVDIFLASAERLMQWMREQHYLAQVPIICIGSSQRSQDVQRAYDLGANAYFPKGVDMADLALLIQQLEFVQDSTQGTLTT